MVGVESAPAESQFGQVAGANHKGRQFVGLIEQNLSALASLGVLEHNITSALGMAQVSQMLFYRGVDGDFLQGYLSGVTQLMR